MPPVSRIDRARVLLPFAVLGALGLLLAPVPAAGLDRWGYAGGTALMVAVGLASLFAPWPRLPRNAPLIPALAYLAAVGLLRQATGGALGGMGALVLLAVVWMALYGTRGQLIAVVCGVAAVWAVPLLLVGAPRYPADGWRACVLFVAVSAMLGATVQRLVARVSEQAAQAVQRDRERALLLARVEELAMTDPLTGLPNRRAWNERLERELADQRQRTICLAALDLDHFKTLNDTYGHEAGDRALRDSAGAWQAELRPNDTLARLGGDEFAVLLVGTELPEALLVIERLREATRGGLSCSAGVVRWDGHETTGELQARADALLYEAKRHGRDRVATPPLPAA